MKRVGVSILGAPQPVHAVHVLAPSNDLSDEPFDARDWCDYVSYDPRLPEHMRMFRKRVERDSNLIMELELAVNEFLIDLDVWIAELQTRYPAPDLLAAAS